MLKNKARAARIATLLIVVLVVWLGAVYKGGWGTLCSFGPPGFSLVCPLGFLQMALAGRTPLPHLWLPVGLALLITLLLGRVFCGWICPSTLLSELFGLKRTRSVRGVRAAKADNMTASCQPAVEQSAGNGGKKSPWVRLPRYGVLGGALLSSLLFGFPVFCLICPIGLFFGTLFAVNRLFATQQLGWELLVFPAMLVLELVVLKSWCRSLCPLGALFGLVGRLARFGRPTVVKDKCLTTTGINCRVCKRACPQGVDLHGKGEGASVGECSRCLECYEKCPTGAIALWPFRAPKGRRKPRVAKAPRPDER